MLNLAHKNGHLDVDKLSRCQSEQSGRDICCDGSQTYECATVSTKRMNCNMVLYMRKGSESEYEHGGDWQDKRNENKTHTMQVIQKNNLPVYWYAN